jgi:hypothetical protein
MNKGSRMLVMGPTSELWCILGHPIHHDHIGDKYHDKHLKSKSFKLKFLDHFDSFLMSNIPVKEGNN